MGTLIFCNDNDGLSFRLFQRLRSAQHPVTLVPASKLPFARNWTHELTRAGKGATVIEMNDGTVIDSKDPAVVFNRIRYIPMLHFRNEKDREYAHSEILALYYSFLNSMKEKLFHPLDIKDISDYGSNNWYIKKKVIEAGLEAEDSMFTSSPRWKTNKNLLPAGFDPFNKVPVNGEDQVRRNQPVLLGEDSKAQKKVWLVGDKIIGIETGGMSRNILKLGHLFQKRVLEIDFVRTAHVWKVRNVNLFPEKVPSEVIGEIFLLLTQTKSDDSYNRHSQ